MYLLNHETKEEMWVRPGSVVAIAHLKGPIFSLVFSDGLAIKIVFEESLHELVQEMGSRGVKVMTSRNEDGIKYFITRENAPKYFGEHGWTDTPFFFQTETLTRAIAAYL